MTDRATWLAGAVGMRAAAVLLGAGEEAQGRQRRVVGRLAAELPLKDARLVAAIGHCKFPRPAPH